MTEALTLFREGDEYVLTADLPDVAPEDVEVAWDDGRLHVAVEGTDAGREVFHETATFYREIDAGNIAASYADGTLELRVPIRRDGVRGMSIEVEAAEPDPGEDETDEAEAQAEE